MEGAENGKNKGILRRRECKSEGVFRRVQGDEVRGRREGGKGEII